MITAFVWSLIVASLLSLTGKTSAKTKIIHASILAIAASLIIMTVIVVFVLVGEMFLNRMI